MLSKLLDFPFNWKDIFVCFYGGIRYTTLCACSLIALNLHFSPFPFLCYSCCLSGCLCMCKGKGGGGRSIFLFSYLRKGAYENIFPSIWDSPSENERVISSSPITYSWLTIIFLPGEMVLPLHTTNAKLLSTNYHSHSVCFVRKRFELFSGSKFNYYNMHGDRARQVCETNEMQKYAKIEAENTCKL